MKQTGEATRSLSIAVSCCALGSGIGEGVRLLRVCPGWAGVRAGECSVSLTIGEIRCGLSRRTNSLAKVVASRVRGSSVDSERVGAGRRTLADVGSDRPREPTRVLAQPMRRRGAGGVRRVAGQRVQALVDAMQPGLNGCPDRRRGLLGRSLRQDLRGECLPDPERLGHGPASALIPGTDRWFVW